MFAETPALNEAIYPRTINDAWGDVVARLRSTHAELRAVIEGYSDDDLFNKQRFAWTRSTSVGAYLVSASSSHYAWASELIRKWAQTRPGTDALLVGALPPDESPGPGFDRVH